VESETNTSGFFSAVDSHNGGKATMLVTTRTCARYGHPEFTLEADEEKVPGSYLTDIAQGIEEMVAQGSDFKPNETFQIGWMVTQVAEHSAGRLTLLEPDMQAFPVRWVPGITETLRQMMLQLFTLDSVSLRDQMAIATMDQSCVVCSRHHLPELFLSRNDGIGPGDSGWFVGCLDRQHDHNDPANIHRVSLYKAFLQQPGIIGYVAFPPGSTIVVDQETGVTITKDGKDLRILAGSFLDRMLNGERKA
jgi:hypothetical protein